MSAGSVDAAALSGLEGRFELIPGTHRLRYRAGADPLLPAGPMFLGRHGETFINRVRDGEGWANSGLDDAVNQLTPTGRDQAVALSRRLLSALERPARSGVRIWVYTSELTRARQTAAPLIERMRDARWQFRVIGDAGLNEIDLGRWNNRLISELPGQSASMRRFRFGADTLVRPPGGESFSTFLQRTQTALRRVIREAAPEPAVIVTHSTVISAMRMHGLDSAMADAAGVLRWTGRGIEPAQCLYFDPDTRAYRPLA